MPYKDAIELAEWVTLKAWLHSYKKTWRDLEKDEGGQYICIDVCRKANTLCLEKIYLPEKL